MQSQGPDIIAIISDYVPVYHYYILQNLKKTKSMLPVTGNGYCEICRRKISAVEPFSFSFFGPIQRKTIYRVRTLSPAVGFGRKSGHVYTLSGQTKML